MIECVEDKQFSRRVARRPAVSIVEVLVVIGILLLLMAMLLPSLSAARERARRLMCMNNLHQWGIAAQCYRDDFYGYLPVEGTYLHGGITKRGTWFNELPPYLGLPSYKDLEGANDEIRELPNMHLWICPSKNLSDAFQSDSGKNQFHYGMNQVLDGLGKEDRPSRDAPDFPDAGPDKPPHAKTFLRYPKTVFMFDISPNSMAGTARDVATVYQRNFRGEYVAKFHGDYANVLYVSGSVGHCTTDDLVTDRDFRHGRIVWTNPKLHWGYRPPESR